MKNKKNILNSIRNIEDRLDLLQEKSYNVELNSSEFKEINKRKRKLEKDKQKLVRKLNQLQSALMELIIKESIKVVRDDPAIKKLNLSCLFII